MATWIIEPRDPLIVRDGRPFGPNPGARATTLPFPPPSVTTGGVRTRAGLGADGAFINTPANRTAVQGIAVRGPLLAELDAGDGTIQGFLAPAPLDALLLEEQNDPDQAIRKWLMPFTAPAGWSSNLPPDLLPVGRPANEYDPRKPFPNAPAYWSWEAFERWLQTPADGPLRTGQTTDQPAQSELWLPPLGNGPPQVPLGQGRLLLSERMHVSITPTTAAQPTTLTAEEGALFRTAGLEFTGPARQRLALVVASNDLPTGFDPGLAPLGGERRIVGWRRADKDFPSCPPAIKAAIIADRTCRVVLLTPAVFEGGYRPTGWLLQPHLTVPNVPTVTPRLRAALVGRPLILSGWDFAQDQAKPTRRLAPAGSVYFLQLDGAPDAIAAWVDAYWLQCISDAPQDRADGFGLAALGTWPDLPQEDPS